MTEGRAPRISVPAGRGCLLESTFTEGELIGLRHRVGRYAADAGLTEGATDDFVLAVNEVMSNAVRHGGGNGLMRVWLGAELVCEIIDDGPGFDVAALAARAEAGTAPSERPALAPSGGLGLWLARQLCDSMSIESGPEGTTIRLSTRLPNGPAGRTP